MNETRAGEGRFLPLLPAFLFVPRSPALRYAATAAGLVLAGHLLLSLIVALLLPQPPRPDFGVPQGWMGIAFLLFGLVVFAPLVETLIMSVPLLVIDRFAGPAPAVIASAAGWGIAHSLAVTGWGLIVWWGFLIFSVAFLIWRRRGGYWGGSASRRRSTRSTISCPRSRSSSPHRASATQRQYRRGRSDGVSTRPRPDVAHAGTAHWPDYRSDFATAFRWLLIGAVTYAATLAVAIHTDPELALVPIVGPSLYLTPVFGTPYVVMSMHRRGRTRRAIFFLALVPLAHMAANYVAWSWAAEHYRPWIDGREFERRLIFGAFGGVTGATLSFTAMLLLGLVPRRKRWLWKAAAGTIALGAVGAFGMAWGLEWSNALDGYAAGPMVLWFECVHLPWQAVFAFFLAWMLRIPPGWRRRRTSPAPPAGH